MPDYHLPSVIFSDEYLPKKDDSKLMYPLNYMENSFVVMNENYDVNLNVPKKSITKSRYSLKKVIIITNLPYGVIIIPLNQYYYLSVVLNT